MTSATPSPAGTDPRLPVRLCLGFGVGTVGVSIMLNTVTAYFPAFLSTVLGKSPEIAGFLLMASKLYDVLADIAIGMAVDQREAAIVPPTCTRATGTTRPTRANRRGPVRQARGPCGSVAGVSVVMLRL